MPDRHEFARYLAQLKRAEMAPLLEGGEEWSAYIARISREGEGAEVTEEQYWPWLELLLPHWMSGSHFCFAEDAEPLRLLWHDRTRDRSFARQLARDDTLLFCTLASIAQPL